MIRLFWIVMPVTPLSAQSYLKYKTAKRKSSRITAMRESQPSDHIVLQNASF